MEVVSENVFAQWGAIGIMVTGLIWFAKYMILHFMNQQKQSFQDNKELETAFRDYLILQAKEHHEIIKANTDAIAKLVEFFDNSFAGYMKSRIEAHDKLSENLDRFIKKIEGDF
jgi:hypothetical protein